ncbi:MAG: hypothetical protein KIS96_12285 [Bauldia sp.]|nr:hypothetical protein [Bauldia sp.]
MDTPQSDRLVHRLYDAALGRSEWTVTMQALAATFAARIAVIHTFPQCQANRYFATPEFEPVVEDWFSSDWRENDPRVRAIRGLRQRGGRQTVTDETVRRYDPGTLGHFRRGFLDRHALGDFAATLVELGRDGGCGVLAFIRDREAPDFSRHDLTRMMAIRGHVEASLHLAEHVLGVADDASAWLRALEEAGTAAVFLTGKGRVVAVSTPAKRLFADDLRVDKDRLVSRSPVAQARIERLVACREGVTTVPRAIGRRPLLVRAVPVSGLAPANGWVFSQNRIEIILILVAIDPRVDHRAGAEALGHLGLSPAEARVAALVGAGASAAKAAERLELTEATVRSYLKRVYAKLEISGRAELGLLSSKIRSLYDLDVHREPS